MLLNTLSTKNDRDSKSDYKRLNDIMLTSEEWDVIRDLIPVLQPFAAATEILGGSSYCTYSIMNPILIDIKKRFYPLTEGGIRAIRQININGNNFETPFDEDIIIEDDGQPPLVTSTTRKIRISEPVNCNGLIDKIKFTLFAAMDHYWNNLTYPEMLLPTLLDPRMKNLNFATDSEHLATKDLLKKQYEELKTQNSNNLSIINVDDNENRRKSQNAFAVFASLKKKVSPENDEVGAYLLLDEIDFDSNPFVWWYERREKFPILSYLAKKYLAVLACSTASERLFSDAGNLLTAKRSRMCPKLFRKLMFLKRNGKYLDLIHKS